MIYTSIKAYAFQFVCPKAILSDLDNAKCFLALHTIPSHIHTLYHTMCILRIMFRYIEVYIQFGVPKDQQEYRNVSGDFFFAKFYKLYMYTRAPTER